MTSPPSPYWFTFPADPTTAKLDVRFCRFIGTPEAEHFKVVDDTVYIRGVIIMPLGRGIRFADWLDSAHPRLMRAWRKVKGLK